MKFPRKTTAAVAAAMAMAMAAMVLVIPAGPATASTKLPTKTSAHAAAHTTIPSGSRFAGAWATAPHHPIPGNDWDGPNWSLGGFTHQSVRQVVRLSTGGSQVRIRLSNQYGTRPLRLAGATIGRTGAGAKVQPGTVRALTFGHRQSTTIPAGDHVASDATALRVSALESVTVTLYFAEPTGPATFHEGGLTTTFRASGDHRFDSTGIVFAAETSHSWYYLVGVDVAGVNAARDTVVAFGDSITDGSGSTSGADNRYPDQLAERLVAQGSHVGVVNAGINGNKLLADSPCYGPSGVSRFDRDVLKQPRARAVIVSLGINDIGAGGFPDYFGCGASPVVAPAQIIDGYQALIRSARRHGIRIIGATITPLMGLEGYNTAHNEAVRDAVNQWIRTSRAFDAVVDLDAVLADPARTDLLRPGYDSGDGLHPNDAGADAIAAAVADTVAHTLR